MYDADGNLLPVLAAEIPSRANGGLAADGKSVVWKLKRGVTWHDGQPFTADDCVFNWQYVQDPATAAATIGSFAGLHGARRSTRTPSALSSTSPRPYWDRAMATSLLIPQAPLRGLRRRQIARGAGQPQARGHRPLQIRGVQARRHAARRDQHRLPHAQPAFLRHPGDQGRRRRHVGRARGAANRRVRLRVEPAGGGRSAQAHGGRRQGPRAHRAGRATSSSCS